MKDARFDASSAITELQDMVKDIQRRLILIEHACGIKEIKATTGGDVKTIEK